MMNLNRVGYGPPSAIPPVALGGGGAGLGGLLGFLGKTAASSNPLTAAALQFGLPLAKELAPMIGGALFGNPEAERAAQLREQSLSAIKGILPAAQNLAKGELPQATIDAVEGAADRSRQASAMSAMRSGQYGSSVGRAQQQQASEQVQDTLARQSLAAQQAGVTQVSGLANQLGLMGQQYAASGNLVDKQRGLLAGRIAEALGEPDEDLESLIAQLNDMGISLSEVLKGYIDRGDLNPVTPVGINPDMMKLFGKLYSEDTGTTQGASKKPFFEPSSTRKRGVSGPDVVPL